MSFVAAPNSATSTSISGREAHHLGVECLDVVAMVLGGTNRFGVQEVADQAVLWCPDDDGGRRKLLAHCRHTGAFWSRRRLWGSLEASGLGGVAHRDGAQARVMVAFAWEELETEAMSHGCVHATVRDHDDTGRATFLRKGYYPLRDEIVGIFICGETQDASHNVVVHPKPPDFHWDDVGWCGPECS